MLAVANKIKLPGFALAVFLLFSSNALAGYYCAWNYGMCAAQSGVISLHSSPGPAGEAACNYLKNSSTPPSPYYNFAGVTGPDYYGSYAVSCWPGGSEIRYFAGEIPNCSGGTDYHNGSCTCPAGQTATNGVCTTAIVQDCPKDQFKDQNNACVNTPNCWNQNPTAESSYFDVATGQCMTYTGPLTICIGANAKYCSVLDDCQKSTEICSNNAANIAANTQRQTTVTPAKKAEAISSATTADNAKNDATAAASAKQAAATAAQQNNAAAQSAASAAPSPSSLQIAATAATEAAAAAQKAANAAASAATTQGYAAEAAAQRDSITPSYPPGRAENAAEAAAAAAGKAVADALKALQGQSPSGGSGSSDEMGTCPDCAKETTQQAIKGKLDELTAGSANTVNPGTPSDFDDNLPTEAEALAKTAYTNKIAEIRADIAQIFTVDMQGQGSLPSFDFGTIAGKHVIVDLSRLTSLSLIGDLILFMAGFIAIRTILDF